LFRIAELSITEVAFWGKREGPHDGVTVEALPLERIAELIAAHGHYTAG
jgi:hypothetical protein